MEGTNNPTTAADMNQGCSVYHVPCIMCYVRYSVELVISYMLYDICHRECDMCHRSCVMFHISCV